MPPHAEDLVAVSRDELRARYPSLVGRPITLLAISGGGADGAFGEAVMETIAKEYRKGRHLRLRNIG